MSSTAHEDSERLDKFLHDYYNLPLPHGSISTILTTAFRALIDAGVVVFDDGTHPTSNVVTVHGGRVQLTKPDSDGTPVNYWWVPQGDLPSFDPVILALKDLLLSIVNSPPWDGPLDHPHTRN